MKKILSVVLCLVMIATMMLFSASSQKAADTGEVLPSTWAAVDGLGRTLSMNSQVGDKKDDKIVAMFYWTWHQPWIKDYAPLTTGSVLDQYPEAVNDWEHPAWTNYQDGRPYFWDEPFYGFYANTDKYVLRKHAELLADAGVDVVFFDTTNGGGGDLFPDSTFALLDVWSELKKQGIDVPQISFILNFGIEDGYVRDKLHLLYDHLYCLDEYEDMFFKLDGKPMIMANPAALDIELEKDKAIFDFFTFRVNAATYFLEDTYRFNDKWGWCSDYPQTKFGKKLFGGVEQMCVSVAQNADENGLTAMNDPVGTVQGRGYAQDGYSYSYTYGGKDYVIDMNTENAHYYGLNFQQQWDYAIAQDPDVIFVTGFNEWIAGRWKEWMGTESAFPDQYNPEYSRDIEPSAGELKDYYYYQLVENVRRFKGADASQFTDAYKSIDISGNTNQWNGVLPEYNHYQGGTHRDSPGWKGYHYTNDTFRNDIVKSKVAYDADNVYFYVQTADALTPSTDSNWMRLFLDTDTSGISPNWEGFEYIVNRSGAGDGTMLLEKSKGGTEFETVGEIEFTVNDNVLQLEIPRSMLSLNGKDVKFGFKWSDNMQQLDVMDFYENGDVAPGGRFTFVFDSTATEKAEQKPNIEFKLFDCIADAFNSIYIKIRKHLNYILS